MINQAKVKSIAKQLINFITDEATKNQYQLVSTKIFSSIKKSWPQQISEFDDIGDYLTFIAWAGKIFSDQKLLKFVDQQMKFWLTKANLNNGFFITPIDCQKPIKPTFLVSPYDHQDAVLGFFELYLLTQKNIYKQALKNLFNALSKISQNNHGFIPNQVTNQLFLAPPWVSSNPAVAGLFAEHAYLYSKQFKDKSVESLTDQLIQTWLKTNLFKQEHLFHQGYNSYLKQLSIYKTTKIMKESSNMIFAMLQRPKKYKTQIKLFTHKLLTFQHSSNAFFAKWDLKNKKIIKDYFDKTQNFTIIDLLIEISLKTNQKNLIYKAEKCAQFWISQANPKTNLIPDYIKPNNKPLYPIAKLDQSADLYSSFLRLYSVTKKKKYLTAALTGAEAMAKSFGNSSWWHRIVSTTTGKPARDQEAPSSDRPVDLNLTKYIGGALRFYLSLYQVLSGKNMQRDVLLQLLSRDR